jgi:hypothetical protein
MINEKDTELKNVDSNLYQGKWIHFGLIAQKPKTTVWVVYNNLSHFELGKVYWSAAWRQYVFATTPESIMFDDGCLATIAKFLDILNEKQKTNKEKNNG